jgi:hypothetical protein
LCCFGSGVALVCHVVGAHVCVWIYRCVMSAAKLNHLSDETESFFSVFES